MSRSAARWLVPAALLAGAVSASATDETLRPYQATYRAIWNGMTVAVSKLKLEQAGDRWIYSSSSSPRGIGRLAAGLFPPRQVSIVRLTGAGVQPLSYESTGGETSKSIDIAYDWDSHRVTGSYEGVPVDQPLAPDVQDDGSVQLALMAELTAGRSPRSFRIIDGNGTREYQFSRDGEATLETPMGRIATVIYLSQKAHSPRITRFWCAPDRGYIPIRVEQTRGDEVQWTLEIESLMRK
jgi:hypothetical protein